MVWLCGFYTGGYAGERIHVDENMTAVIREKVDQYYFHVYMQKYLLLN